MSASSGDISSGEQIVRLYYDTITSVPQPISDLLATYSGIPTSLQISHILSVREQAYKLHQYPCLGRFRFLDLDLSTHPVYQTYILPTLLSPYDTSGESQPRFLDLGCCLGQDIRQLIVDGVPAAVLYGADLLPEFIDVGYMLFKDEQKLPRSQFLAPADVFDMSPSNSLSAKHEGAVTILHVCAVFHLFHLPEQRQLARRCLSLLNTKSRLVQAPDSNPSQPPKILSNTVLICGAQTANVVAGEYSRRTGPGRYRHNEQSWEEMWREIAFGSTDNGGSHNEWKPRIKSIKVTSQLERRGRFEGQNSGESQDDNGQGHEVADPSVKAVGANNYDQKQSGSPEKGFRWMKWSALVEFE